MPRRQSDQVEQEMVPFDLACLDRRRSGDAQDGNRLGEAASSLHLFVFRVLNFIALSALAFICWGVEISRAQETDFRVYVRAAEFCRASAKRPIDLDLDKRILCFDGEILEGQDISLVNSLVEGGLFVVRSPGGSIAVAVALAEVLRDRHATVVVYDYCLLACASFLSLASENTFVLKDSLIAWHYSTDPLWCPTLETAKDGGPKRLEIAPCAGATRKYQDGYSELRSFSHVFYKTRSVDPLAEWPPQSVFVRKALKSAFEGTGGFPDAFWMWNPRYYAGKIKTKIFYESYPRSQDEVDTVTRKIGLPHVIYDP